MKQNLALFDFDGTISKKDSMMEFMKFLKGKNKLYLSFFINSHWLILMYLGLIERSSVKEKIWTYLFGNIKLEEFNLLAKKFSMEILPSILYQSALDQIETHKKNGDRIIIVTASAENWLKPWCDFNQLELICTQMEVKKGRLTGKIKGENCNGLEKVNRIRQIINLDEFDKIYAYGNSAGDKAMLNLATHQFYNHFKNI